MSNIVNAVFDGSRRKAITCPLFQYDYGQILKISGIELPASYQVQFSNTEDAGVSKTMLGDADGVQIPDEYLLTGDYIYAFVYLHETEDDGETEYVIEIPVIRRPVPSEETPTPAEQSLIDQLLAQLNQGVEAAEAAAEQAGQAAETAVAGMIDDTLTIQGKAADAKATGDEIIQLKSNLSDETTAREETDTAINEALETKAEIDGYYDEMAVGSAEQLISTVLTVDEEPYKFRTSGGAKDIGNRETDKIVGGSIVWNQFVDVKMASITPNGSATYSTANIQKAIIENHVYVFRTDITYSGSKTLRAYIQAGSIYGKPVQDLTGSKGSFAWIIKPTANRTDISLEMSNIATSDKLTSEDAWTRDNTMLFDLTQMFGTAVADYIYSLEQASAGAGVAYFKKLFPNDYYAYNSGEMMHVAGLQSHDMVGFNQWDEEWELGSYNETTGEKASGTNTIRSKNLIPVLPNTPYYFKSPWAGRLLTYSADGTYLRVVTLTANAVFTTSANTHFIAFRSGSGVTSHEKGSICINLSWSGHRNGEYEPYKKHSYALDSSLTLRGIPKVDTDGLYFDGDTYESDGTVTRRYGVVDLGTLTWSYNTSTHRAATHIPDIKLPSAGNEKTSTFTQNGYTQIAPNGTLNADGQYAILPNGQVLFYYDGEHVPTGNMVYELAAPTTETATPYTNPQVVDDFGTEEYVSESIVPVGHYTEYQANLRDKLQHLPDLADDDGYYVIQQTDHQMTLKNFRIPQAPTADGTYILKATVSGGTPTYTWESEA